ncbi:TRAP transporter small permease subunit [Saezia sanguinis]|uniref:TRAP transporter small permease subunit n=1 Tax=Saezia sanguinis TaxID=1965230 RepID=UPI00304F1E55
MMNFLLKCSHIIDGMNGRIGRALIWLILLATLISTVNAITRKFFNLSSNAFLEIQWYLFAAVFLLGAGYAFLRNVHVRVDVLAQKFSAKTRNVVDIVGITLFVLPLCYCMISFAWPVVMQAIHSGESSANAGGLVRWPAYILVPAGFTLLALQACSELIKRLAFVLDCGPDPLAPSEPEIQALPAEHPSVNDAFMPSHTTYPPHVPDAPANHKEGT